MKTRTRIPPRQKAALYTRTANDMPIVPIPPREPSLPATRTTPGPTSGKFPQPTRGSTSARTGPGPLPPNQHTSPRGASSFCRPAEIFPWTSHRTTLPRFARRGGGRQTVRRGRRPEGAPPRCIFSGDRNPLRSPGTFARIRHRRQRVGVGRPSGRRGVHAPHREAATKFRPKRPGMVSRNPRAISRGTHKGGRTRPTQRSALQKDSRCCFHPR
jgi:hypothetical protein